MLRSFNGVIWGIGAVIANSNYHWSRPPLPLESTPLYASAALNLYGLTIGVDPTLLQYI